MASSSSFMVLARSVMANRSTKKCPLNPSRAIPDEAGADNGIRTRDNQLGRLELYQLSYVRNLVGSRESNPATEV